MWNIEARRAEVGKVPRGVGYGEGVSTLDLQMVTFGAFCWFFLQFSCLFYTQKLVLLGSQNLPL